jgi:LmbE family N-acetylglucosaminyl deacetylase
MSNPNVDHGNSDSDGLKTEDVIILTCVGDEAVATNAIYLSPHLDDVALSCGGRIHLQAQAGVRSLVVTIFAGAPLRSELSPFAAELHAHWGHLAEPVAVRREEDEKAMHLLGAHHIHLKYPDAVYRFDDASFLYLCDDDLFGSLHPSDLKLVSQIREAIVKIHARHRSTIYAPLAVGNHVDHQLVRAAALTLHRRSYPVVFYEDYPYVEMPGALTRELERIGIERWTEQVQNLDEKDLAIKIEAIASYASQVDRLFQGGDLMAERVRGYALTVGSEEGYGERYWALSYNVKSAMKKEPR